MSPFPSVFLPSLFLKYDDFLYEILVGNIPDYRKRQKKGYSVSSFVNLKYLGFRGLPTEYLHPECVRQPVQSWKKSAEQMKEYLEGIE